MKKLASYLVVPLLFLIGSLAVYFASESILIPMIDSSAQLISQLESDVAKSPEDSKFSGIFYQLEAQKNLLGFHQNLLSALWHFLVEGAIGLFLISVGIQAYVCKKLLNYS